MKRRYCVDIARYLTLVYPIVKIVNIVEIFLRNFDRIVILVTMVKFEL